MADSRNVSQRRRPNDRDAALYPDGRIRRGGLSPAVPSAGRSYRMGYPALRSPSGRSLLRRDSLLREKGGRETAEIRARCARMIDLPAPIRIDKPGIYEMPMATYLADPVVAPS